MQLVRTSALASAVAAAAALAILSPTAASASALTPGDFLLLRAGDGSVDQAAGVSASVFLDEYSPAGSLVQSIPVPASGADALTIGSHNTTEGPLSFSTDGNFAVFSGFRRDALLSNGSGQTADVAPRVIGRLALDGTLDTSTVIKSTADGAADLFSSSSVRGVASTDGSHFWVAGISKAATISSGVVYVDGFGPSAVGTVISTANSRGASIADGNLYTSRASSITKYDGLPVDASSVPTDVLNIGSGGGYESFTLLDLSPSIPGVDTLYAGNTTNIEKWSFDGSAWTNVGSVPTGQSANALYITSSLNNDGSVSLFFTTTGNPATTSSVLATFTDASGYNAAPTGSVSTLLTAPTNTSFHGLAFVPLAATPSHNPGDTNNDGVVDLTDLNNVLNNFGSTGANPGDDNTDGTVDLTDLNNVLNNFGTTYAAAALNVVPEPASLSLLALGATSLLARRRRSR